MKAIIIFAMAILLLVSCEKEQPTKVTQEVTFDKHTIQNDSNWVEITDIDTMDYNCIHPFFLIDGFEFNSNEEILEKYNLSKSYSGHIYNFYKICDTLIYPNVNFAKDVLYGFSWGMGGSWKSKIKVFKHITSNVLVIINSLNANEDKSFTVRTKYIKFPKNNFEKFYFDTVEVYELIK